MSPPSPKGEVGGPPTVASPPPTVLAVDEGAEIMGGAGPTHLRLHQQVNGWTLMACPELQGNRVAVFEQHVTELGPDEVGPGLGGGPEGRP